MVAGRAIQEMQGMDVQKLFCTFLIGAGLANILSFWAPVQVPTVGITVFVIVGLCIGTGLAFCRFGNRLPSSTPARLSGLRSPSAIHQISNRSLKPGIRRLSSVGLGR